MKTGFTIFLFILLLLLLPHFLSDFYPAIVSWLSVKNINQFKVVSFHRRVNLSKLVLLLFQCNELTKSEIQAVSTHLRN